MPDEPRFARRARAERAASERIEPGPADGTVVEKFGWQFRARDKVIQTENDYDKEVFNGDIGQIVKIDPLEQRSHDPVRPARGRL